MLIYSTYRLEVIIPPLSEDDFNKIIDRRIHPEKLRLEIGDA